MTEQRQQVSVRAKSVLKLDTGQTSLDFDYDKKSTIDGIAKNIMHAVIFNKGMTEARKFFREFLDGYDFDYRDPVIAPDDKKTD